MEGIEIKHNEACLEKDITRMHKNWRSWSWNTTNHIEPVVNDLGFEDLEEVDVLDLLNADIESLSHEELVQFEEERTLGEETEPAVCKQLTLKNLPNALSHFEQGINILQNDSNV